MVVDEVDLVVRITQFQDHSKLVVADPIIVQVAAAVPTAAAAAVVVPVLVVPVNVRVWVVVEVVVSSDAQSASASALKSRIAPGFNVTPVPGARERRPIGWYSPMPKAVLLMGTASCLSSVSIADSEAIAKGSSAP